MKLDTLALCAVAGAAGLWVLVYGGMALFFAASFSPLLALVVLAVVAPFAYLLARVVADRLGNAEDDHYERTVER
ncbi:MAG: hypothetical protein AAF321_10565 [Pseudomonadota bacterium]